MDRQIVSASVILTGLLVAMPTLAQDYQWTSDRPDGHAPAGVKADFTLSAGEYYVGYRHTWDGFQGTLIGTQELFFDEVLDFGFTVAPLTHDQSRAELDVRYGLTDDFTVEVSLPFLSNKLLQVTDLVFFESSSKVLGDVSIRMLADLLEMDEYRLSVNLGATVPTGKLGKRGVTATSNQAVLPFLMQGGSGSPDILAGATFQVQNEVSSVGVQINSVVRAFNNPKGYRLGNRVDFSVWGAYNISEWASVSLRGFYENWGRIEGSDSRTDGAIDPLANPFAQGGERVVVPLGLNLYLREGKAAGHRLSIEFYYPVHEDLNGPQLSSNRTIVISWQSVFF